MHLFKGTVSLISSNPSCKDDNARFTTVLYRDMYPIWSEMWKTSKALNLIARNAQFCIEIKVINVKKQKLQVLIHTWSEEAFDYAVVKRALSSLHGGSLENKYKYINIVRFILFKKNNFTKIHFDRNFWKFN